MGHISGSFLTLSILLYLKFGNMGSLAFVSLLQPSLQCDNWRHRAESRRKIIQREDFTAIIHLKFLEDICNENTFSGP